jgi:flagellin
MGSNSELSFAGDENVINSLGLAQIQNATKPQTTVNVYDAHTNEFIGGDTVCDGILRGVIKGIDVKVDDTMGVTSRWDPVTGSVVFDPRAEANVAFLHVVDNRTEVQIGANEGQKFDISIAQMNTTALEIDDVFVTTMAQSQKAITKLDMAMERLNGARATIGAQINRLEYTMQNLAVSRQNLIAGESRIRDLDVASASAEFARNQILVNTSVAMLAQANQLPSIAMQLIG